MQGLHRSTPPPFCFISQCPPVLGAPLLGSVAAAAMREGQRIMSKTRLSGKRRSTHRPPSGDEQEDPDNVRTSRPFAKTRKGCRRGGSKLRETSVDEDIVWEQRMPRSRGCVHTCFMCGENSKDKAVDFACVSKGDDLAEKPVPDVWSCRPCHDIAKKELPFTSFRELHDEKKTRR